MLNPKMITSFFVCLALMIGQVTPSYAQSDSTSIDQETAQILNIVYKLPPLQNLIDTALQNASTLKGRELLIRVKENDLARMRHDWLDVFSIQGGTSYGNGSISASQQGLNDAIISNNSTLRFSLGLSLSFSPSYWMQRKHEVDIRRAQLSYERTLKQESEKIVEQAVITAYLALEFYRDAFLVANAGYESNHATILLCEKQFLEGDIDIAMYNDIKLKHTKLALEIEGYKRNLKKAYYDLERALGCPLSAFAAK